MVKERRNLDDRKLTEVKANLKQNVHGGLKYYN